MFSNAHIESLPVQTGRGTGPVPLHGVLIADFTHYIAGAYASMMLADLGATVIKIEPPGKGDDFRYYPPHADGFGQDGAAYLWANRNKLSCAVDLKHPQGKQWVLDLLAQADVLIENYSTGVMDKLGLGYEALQPVRPNLVYCSVSAYGRKGSQAHRSGFDSVIQGESGFASQNGYADRPGVRAASPVMDIATAMMASNAVLAALLHRSHTGQGQYVEVAMCDVAAGMTGYAAMQTLCTGLEPMRHGNVSPDTSPTGVFSCADGEFFLHCGNTAIFQRLFEQVVQRPDIAFDPAYQHSAGRRQGREYLTNVLQTLFQAQPWSLWQQRLASVGVPAGLMQTVGAALHSPLMRERGMVGRLAHPTLGWVPNVASPLRFAESPVVQAVAAPLLGQHTRQVSLDVLAWPSERLNAALEQGALQAGGIPECVHKE